MPRHHKVTIGRKGQAQARTITDSLAVASSTLWTPRRYTLTDGMGLSDSRVQQHTVEESSDFPTFTSTGVRSGVSLVTDTRTTVPSGSSHSGRDFVNELQMDGVSNVTFTDCRINVWRGGYNGVNRVLNYCDVDGNEGGTFSAADGVNLTANFCRFWNAAVAFYDYGGAHLTDCFFGEHYMSGEAHGEPIMAAGDNSEYDHCTLIASFKPGGNELTGPGGLSACVALYTHAEFWGPRSNVWMHDCLMSAPNANHIAYWGTAGIGDDPLTNCVLENCTIRKPPGSSTGSMDNGTDIEKNYFGGSGNRVSGNVYEDSGLPCGGND